MRGTWTAVLLAAACRAAEPVDTGETDVPPGFLPVEAAWRSPLVDEGFGWSLSFGTLAGEPVLLVSSHGERALPDGATVDGDGPRVDVILADTPLGVLGEPRSSWLGPQESLFGYRTTALDLGPGLVVSRSGPDLLLVPGIPSSTQYAETAAWATFQPDPASGATVLTADLTGDGVPEVIVGGGVTHVLDGAALPGFVELARYSLGTCFESPIVAGRFTPRVTPSLVLHDCGHDDLAGALYSVDYVEDLVDLDAMQPDLAGGPGDHLGDSLATGDLDGDGDLDLAVASRWADDGRGHVDLVVDAGDAPIGSVLASVPGPEPGGGTFGDSVRLHDFDGDGRSELVVSAPASASSPDSGTVYVFWEPLSDDPWTSVETLRMVDGPDRWSDPGLAIGDLDGDGVDELFVAAAGAVYRVVPNGPP